jgi:hypothetical protein
MLVIIGYQRLNHPERIQPFPTKFGRRALCRREDRIQTHYQTPASAGKRPVSEQREKCYIHDESSTITLKFRPEESKIFKEARLLSYRPRMPKVITPVWCLQKTKSLFFRSFNFFRLDYELD